MTTVDLTPQTLERVAEIRREVKTMRKRAREMDRYLAQFEEELRQRGIKLIVKRPPDPRPDEGEGDPE